MPKRERRPSIVAILILCLAWAATQATERMQAQTSRERAAIHSSTIPEDSPAMGPADASVTIVEFSDFQCPFCRRVAPVVRELVTAYPGKVRHVFRHAPLAMHAAAPLAHEAALAAGAQGKFWEMHDLLFANQRQLGRDNLLRYAEQLGLDQASFRDALDRHRFRPDVERDRAEAARLGISGTPSFLINGRPYRGALTRSEFDRVIAAELRGPAGIAAAGNPPDIELSPATTAGPAEAEVSIVAFSDFACPHSRAMAATLAELLRRHPDHLRVAFKHFPAPNNNAARLAHVVAAAAAAQGKFWAWHERAFALRGDLRTERLVEAAQQVELSGIGWDADHPLDTFDADVERDLAEGRRLGVHGTPTVFINGTRLQGVQPLPVLDSIVATERERVARQRRPPATARSSRVARGPADAPVVIVWYSDVQSPLGPPTAELLARVQRAFPRDVRVTFRHRPLEFHPQAALAHQALAAAAEKDRFWQMLALLHSHQDALGEADLASYATRVGLDRINFLAALKSGFYRAAVEEDLAEARRLDVRGVPVMFVNDTRVEGVLQEYQLRQLIETELQRTAAPRASAIRPAN